MGVPVKKRHFRVPIKALSSGALDRYISQTTVSYFPELNFNLFQHLLFVITFGDIYVPRKPHPAHAGNGRWKTHCPSHWPHGPTEFPFFGLWVSSTGETIPMVPYLILCQNIIRNAIFWTARCWRLCGCDNSGVSYHVSRPGATKILILSGRGPLLFLKRRFLILYLVAQFDMSVLHPVSYLYE